DGLGELAEVEVAVVEFAPGLGDADDGLGQVDVVEAGGLEPGAAGQPPVAGLAGATAAAGQRGTHRRRPRPLRNCSRPGRGYGDANRPPEKWRAGELRPRPPPSAALCPGAGAGYNPGALTVEARPCKFTTGPVSKTAPSTTSTRPGSPTSAR